LHSKKEGKSKRVLISNVHLFELKDTAECVGWGGVGPKILRVSRVITYIGPGGERGGGDKKCT